MNPRDCGTCNPPPEDSPDREELDRFADFLRDCKERGAEAVWADPKWTAYIRGEQ